MGKPLTSMVIRGCSLHHTFGMVRNGGTKAHQGWDLAAPVGTPIYAIRSGTIVDCGEDDGYGLQLILEFTHVGLPAYAVYAHLSRVLVGKKVLVKEGDLLGFTGRTGNAKDLPKSQEHLHFEIRMLLPRPGKGLSGRIDPGEVLGYEVYGTPVHKSSHGQSP